MAGQTHRDGIGSREPLETFLASIDPEAAAELRVIAAKIDTLTRAADTLADVEQQLLPWAGGAGLLFLAGLWMLLQMDADLALPTTFCLSAMPVVAAIYAWRIRPRTQADNAAQDLNRAHFLPFGCLYFPTGAEDACIVRVEWTPPPPDSDQPPPHLRDPRKPENRIGSSW